MPWGGHVMVPTSMIRIAVLTALFVLAQRAGAAVLILEGTASTTTTSPTNKPVEQRVPLTNEPAPITQPDPLRVSKESGILEPAASVQTIVPFPPADTEAAAASYSGTPASPQLIPSDIGTVKVANSAEVTVEMKPGRTLRIGSRVSFRITSKKAGYLVLIDVDATGHLTQIYPNTAILVRLTKPNSNFIKAGGTLSVPLADSYGGGFEYVVSPPNGQAMIVAILSAQPVQILDLPDVAGVQNQSEALTFLVKRIAELRIPEEGTSQLREAGWSFNAQSYTIQQ